MEFTREELEEIKRSLNTLISERIRYGLIENNETRRENNQNYLDLDYAILEKVLKELDKGEIGNE